MSKLRILVGVFAIVLAGCSGGDLSIATEDPPAPEDPEPTVDEAEPTAEPEDEPEPEPTEEPEPEPTEEPEPEPTEVPVGAYGSDPDLDALWDQCSASDFVACDDLYWTSPIDSDYEAYGSTCGETADPLAGGCQTEFGPDEPAPETGLAFEYGDDAELDGIWDLCAAGDLSQCDKLYYITEIDSDYERFGATCGDTIEFIGGQCLTWENPAVSEYGDNAALDALWDACALDGAAACDDLWWSAPRDSVYELFGQTCGERVEPELESAAGNCTIFG